jgi:hypothetical protein
MRRCMYDLVLRSHKATKTRRHRIDLVIKYLLVRRTYPEVSYQIVHIALSTLMIHLIVAKVELPSCYA